MLEPVLPYLGPHIFAAFLQDMDQKTHLSQIERIVFKGELGIFCDCVDFLPSMSWLEAEGVSSAGIFGYPVRVVILLKHISQIKMPELVGSHRRIVYLVFGFEFREVVFAVGIERSGSDCFDVGSLHDYFA